MREKLMAENRQKYQKVKKVSRISHFLAHVFESLCMKRHGTLTMEVVILFNEHIGPSKVF